METSEIHQTLKSLLLGQIPPLRVKQDSETNFEVTGTREAMQGRQKVDGFYFASLVPKPNDIRFYFFPLYTDPGEFELSGKLKKMLKGKTCFHIKKLDEPLIGEIREMIAKGVKIYVAKGLV